MSDEVNKPGHGLGKGPDEQPDCQGGKLDGGMSVGALIRAAADDELTDSQIEAFEQLCAERDCTNDRVRFEQTLREACGKSMADQPQCPDALRNKIRAIAAAGGDTGMAHEAGSAPSAVEAMAEQTRSASFWQRSPGMLAMAAVLALFAGVMIFQGLSVPAGPVPTGWTVEQASNRDRMAAFVAKEHNRCCNSDRASEAKLIIRDMDRAKAYFVEALGVAGLEVTPAVAEVGEVSFWGAGDCHVPASSSSGHFRFDATTPEGTDIRLSLFVLPDEGQFPMNEATTYRVGSEACDKAGVNLFAWKDAGVVYMLVSEADGGFCEVVRDTMRAPVAVDSL